MKTSELREKLPGRNIFKGKYGVRTISLVVFSLIFATVGVLMLFRSKAATGSCSTTGVIGTSTHSIAAPESAQYRVWLRMQVPDINNINNTNGVRLEIAGSSVQCFTLTTTNVNAVNQWLWINSDALAPATPHISDQITAGNYTAKVLGLKAGVKVDKVLMLKSDNTCQPSNDVSAGIPGENCTTVLPPTNACDFTADGRVNIQDLVILLNNYGNIVTIGKNGDCNGDGSVTILDLVRLINVYGQ